MNIYQRASQFWAVLAFAASRTTLVTHEELSEVTGSAPCSDEMKQSLNEIEAYCQENGFPSLTNIVVSKESGEPQKKFRDWERVVQQAALKPWNEHWEEFEGFLKKRENAK